MAQRYAVQFEVEPAAASGAALLGAVAEAALSWLRNRSHLELAGTAGVWGEDGNRVSVDREAAGGRAAFRFIWQTRPQQVAWSIELQLSTAGEAVVVHATATSDEAGADQPGVRVAVVWELVEQFACRRRGSDYRLRARPQQLAAADVPRFVQEQLAHPERDLPLVCVSAPPGGGPLVAADDLQRTLAGQANVFVLDQAASQALSEAVGHRLSCYAGAVRIYAPQFTPQDRPTAHRFWIANQLRRPFATVWREMSAEAGQLTLPPSGQSDFYYVRDEIKELEIEALRQAADADLSLEQQVKALQRQVELYKRQRDDALTDRDRFHNQYEEVQRRLDQQTTATERTASEGDVRADSVEAALHLADTRKGEFLRFLPSAFASAKECNYRQPQLVLESLAALNELSRELHEGRLDEPQIMQALNDRNHDCSGESTDTMRRFGDLRRFRDETQQLYEMPLHIKLGGGSGQDNLARIHFCWDAAMGELVVGHVGRHLRTGRS